MRLYEKWLSVGLLALAPGALLAGPAPGAAPYSRPATAAARTGAADKDPNQELAEKIAKSLKKSKLNGYDIQIDVRNGVVTLDGSVATPEQRQAAAKASQKVAGVTGVYNRLRVAGPAAPAGAVQQTAGTSKGSRSAAVRQANFQSAQDGRGPVQQVAGVTPGMPAAMLAQTPSAPMALPAYGQPDAAGGHTIYNQPNLPNYSWPTYAQYPNYAAVTYPSQYSASAWPYIGPFYPYPQVPLNWRKATLEWNEGTWNLSFDSKFNRWCWFLDPKSW